MIEESPYSSTLLPDATPGTLRESLNGTTLKKTLKHVRSVCYPGLKRTIKLSSLVQYMCQLEEARLTLEETKYVRSALQQARV